MNLTATIADWPMNWNMQKFYRSSLPVPHRTGVLGQSHTFHCNVLAQLQLKMSSHCSSVFPSPRNPISDENSSTSNAVAWAKPNSIGLNFYGKLNQQPNTRQWLWLGCSPIERGHATMKFRSNIWLWPDNQVGDIPTTVREPKTACWLGEMMEG